MEAAAITRNAELKLKIAEIQRKQRERAAAQELLNENKVLAQRLRELKKVELEAKKPRKVYTRAKPYDVNSNPYMRFLKQNRLGLRDQILAVQPLLTGKELTCAITTLAGHRWREMSEEDRASFKIIPVRLFADDSQESVVETGLEFNPDLNLWIDLNSGLVYEQNSLDNPPNGWLIDGILLPFLNAN
jgi:hypothetical protein